MNPDNTFMYDALNYARQHAVGDQGHVGAVLVYDDAVHVRGASDDNEGMHAEQAVLANGVNAIASTAYVTIQPSLYRTDESILSDSELLIQSGVNRVVLGSPNKKYSLQESIDFFTQNDVEFSVIENPKLSAKCLKLFTSTGADQTPKQ